MRPTRRGAVVACIACQCLARSRKRLGLISISQHHTILLPHFVPIPGPVAEAVAVRQTAQRAWVIVDADCPAAKFVSNIFGNSLTDEHGKAREQNSAATPVVRDAPHRSGWIAPLHLDRLAR